MALSCVCQPYSPSQHFRRYAPLSPTLFKKKKRRIFTALVVFVVYPCACLVPLFSWLICRFSGNCRRDRQSCSDISCTACIPRPQSYKQYIATATRCGCFEGQVRLLRAANTFPHCAALDVATIRLFHDVHGLFFFRWWKRFWKRQCHHEYDGSG